ncbi:MAG: ribosome small subunit-dependent GTPase A [Planctomycetia bacterium]|nr:ribosome small subunit-dependent GTPase A [Planctomycetia bacterium]
MADKSFQKLRVEFRRNRNTRTRVNDWTRKYENDETGVQEDLTSGDERISGKGELVRKRTIVGTRLEVDSEKGDRGDFTIHPETAAGRSRPGRVLSVHGLYCRVEDESGTVFTCVTRRLLKTISTDQRQIVVTGDKVYFRDALVQGRQEGIIERVEPRQGSLSRTSRNRKHLIVTNVDQAILVASLQEPYLKPNLIDRLLVTCDRSGIRPIICINKVDLGDVSPWIPLIGVYSQMGYKVVLTSTKTGFGVERLRRLLCHRSSVLTGQSGVGKSSLLNAIDSSLALRVREVSDVNQKGKHTTTTAELLRLSGGGYVVDTPGIRQFSLWDFVPEEIVGYYRDLRPYENLCRFPDCTHRHEESCAVKNAVADGHLDLGRYESYLSMNDEQ